MPEMIVAASNYFGVKPDSVVNVRIPTNDPRIYQIKGLPVPEEEK